MAAPYKLVVCVFGKFVSYALEGLTVSQNKIQTKLLFSWKCIFCHCLLDLGAVQGWKLIQKESLDSFNRLIVDHFF